MVLGAKALQDQRNYLGVEPFKILCSMATYATLIIFLSNRYSSSSSYLSVSNHKNKNENKNENKQK